jgi:hypothetical protein
MNLKVLFGAGLIIGALIMGACGQRSASSDESRESASLEGEYGDLGEGAILKFDTLHHAFGELKSGEEVACRFAFTNTGTAPLLIRDVKAGCGCTNVQFPQKPLKPGESGSVELTFNTSGKRGHQQQNVVVLSNAQEPSILLSITAQVQ